MIENGGHEPVDWLGISDAVQNRTERLTREGQRILSLAAVAGRRFDFMLLQRIAGNHERLLP